MICIKAAEDASEYTSYLFDSLFYNPTSLSYAAHMHP